MMYSNFYYGFVMGTRLIKRGSLTCRNLVIVAAKKPRNNRTTRRPNFHRKMKQFAVILYGFASFVLVLLEIWTLPKS